MTRVKLCGVASIEAMRAVGAARPDAIGLVLAASPRRVTPELAEELLGWVPPGVQRWAVFRTPDPETLSAIAHLPFTGAQGDASWDGRGLPAGWAFLPVLNDGPDLVERARALGYDGAGRDVDGLIGALLVDGPQGGGRGVRADPDRCRAVARLAPLVLAGGLHDGNVADAVRTIRPYAVDVSSGIESSPAVKDPERTLAFAARARAAS